MKRLDFLALSTCILLALPMAMTQPSSADQPKQKSAAPVSSSAATSSQPETVHFVLHPAEPPYAVFKYRLLPHGMETTPGNAAPHYFRAALAWSNDPNFQAAIATPNPNAHSKLEDWIELPLDQLSKNEEAQKFYNSCPTGKWDVIDLAARREECQWDLPIREFNISTLIPELHEMRDLARLLAFKARIEMSRGQIDEALETLKTGMAMGRHAAQAPTLVNAMVGNAIIGLMLNQVRELIQQPKCPNLYWALTALPNPLVDLRYGLEFEGDFVYLFLPELRDVRTAVHTEAEWDRILLEVANKLIKVLPGVGDQPKDLEWYGMGALFAITAYPKAKEQLKEAGYSPSQIKAMCTSQAILTAEVETFEHLSNNIHKWFYADPQSALRGLADAEENLAKFGKSKQEIIPLASILLPSLSKAKSVEVEADRYVAALRTVEAARFYAAEHGSLPQQLSDIHEVPIPNDPMTGQPFSYQVVENGALISSPTPPGETASQALRWEIRLVSGK